ncbi:hypothetical protein ABPG77_008004 [Micractinium sp. CCAP 211/92]
MFSTRQVHVAVSAPLAAQVLLLLCKSRKSAAARSVLPLPLSTSLAVCQLPSMVPSAEQLCFSAIGRKTPHAGKLLRQPILRLLPGQAVRDTLSFTRVASMAKAIHLS